MLDSKQWNGVTFNCRDEEQAEKTRIAALILKKRCDYEYKTRRRGRDLTVYTCHPDKLPTTFCVDLKHYDK